MNMETFNQFIANGELGLECGGRAQRRHRFCAPERSQSGVALRFPPQSKISGFAAPHPLRLCAIPF